MSGEWRSAKLGDVLTLEYGKPLPESGRVLGGQYPVFGANGEIARTDRSYHEYPAIIVGRKGSAGALALSEGGFWPLDVTYFTVFDRTKYDLHFLHYLLQTLDLPRLAKGVKPGINREEVYSLPIRVPQTLAEQRRIVAILDDAVAGLGTAAANAEKNLKNARELFAVTLAAALHRCADWTTSTLGAEARFVDYRGKTPPKRPSGVRLITAKNVKKDHIQREPEEFIDAGAYDAWMTRGFPVKGDVLFTTEAPMGNVAQLDTDEKVVIGQRLITMQPYERIERTFLKYLLLGQAAQKEMAARATGATVLGIKASLLKGLPISFPSLHRQLQIVTKLDELKAAVDDLQAYYFETRERIATLRRSLLTAAFAGKLEAIDAIPEAAE